MLDAMTPAGYTVGWPQSDSDGIRLLDETFTDRGDAHGLRSAMAELDRGPGDLEPKVYALTECDIRPEDAATS